MTTIIDANLTLKYKNMVGFKNITTDPAKGLIFSTKVSINSNLFICGNSILNNLSVNSNLFISGSAVINSNTTLKSVLNIAGPVNINGFVSINSSLNILGNTNINNKLSVNGSTIYNGPIVHNSNMYVSNYTTFQNGINVNNITGTTINLNSSTINIGNPNSMVFINGTANSLASSELVINNKLIALNVNSTNFQGTDLGSSSGIQIMGINSYGFIMTTSNASRYQIKTPLIGSPTNYITIQDLNNNLIISGNSTLIGAVSVISNILVSGGSILNNYTSINNSLNISGSTTMNSSFFNNSLIINGSTTFNNRCSILSSLNVYGLTNINNLISINSSLNISGSAKFNNTSVKSMLNISDITNFNNSISINGSLNVSSFAIINGLISMNSYLNITGSTNIIGNSTINSRLFVSNTSIFNNATTFKSSLTISGSSIFNNAVSIKSNLEIFGQLISALPNYNLNIDAKNGGVPIWGWYRTGGVIKIRLNDIPPTVYLSGSTSLTIYQGLYTDPGAYAIDYFNNYNLVYLTSILSGSSNLLTSNILISGTTLITQTSILPAGLYTTTYRATDSCNNYGYNYRTLNIIIPPPPPPTSGLIFFVDPSTYNSNSNLWIDKINNATVIPTSNTIWNSTNKYFVIQNNSTTNTSQLSVTSPGLINGMKSIFLVLSFTNITTARALINADLSASYYINLGTNKNYYGATGYTDTVSNNASYDGKFHVYLATGINWGNRTTLYFGGAYAGVYTQSFPMGTRVAAIGIYDHNLDATERSTIQTWFNSWNFSLL